MDRVSKNRLLELSKVADREQNGIFQHFQTNVTDYATREKYLSQRGGEPVGRSTDDLYGLSAEGDDSYMPEQENRVNHLSTRYSPDRPGVQTRRIADGVFQDPYTNKIYDYNDGFKTEDGREFSGGSPALQSSLMNMANHLDNIGLVKEANYLDALIRRAATIQGSFFSTRSSEPLTTEQLKKLMIAHEDSSSTYKLDVSRLAGLNLGNLSSEERGILGLEEVPASTPGHDGSDPNDTSALHAATGDLINIATELDEAGHNLEADKLDNIIRKLNI